MDFMPHGVCWRWDWLLILLHAPADIATFGAYVVIATTALVVYWRGRLGTVASTYPPLWRLGAAFVGLCGISHLGAFLEVFIGGSLYWVTGVNKVLMAIVSVWFAVVLWRVRNRLLLAGQVLATAREMGMFGDDRLRIVPRVDKNQEGQR